MCEKVLIADDLIGVYQALTMGLGVFDNGTHSRKEPRVWTWSNPAKCNQPRSENVKAQKKKKHRKKMDRKRRKGY